ncbi:trehalose operon repressor, partial [Vibrio parahaemolyticus]|nr:trehalose operon repressor [Vibrio parahaemolyticus]
GYTLAGEKSAKMLINQLNGDEGVVHFTQYPVCR